MRKIIVLLATSAVLALVVCGCGRKDQKNTDNENAASVNTEENSSVGQEGAENVLDTENTSQLQLGSAVEIPENFKGQPAETRAHEQLERAIAEYSKIPEEEYGSVRYAYHYVDLNDDGKNEILALVLGQEAKSLNENLLLWLDESDSELISASTVRQVFHQVGTPVYISSHTTQGYRDLILIDTQNASDGMVIEDMPGTEEVDASNAGRSADGEPTAMQKTAGLDATTGQNGVVPISMDQTYMLLSWKGDKYQEYDEGTALFSLEGYEGTAILTSNTKGDMEGGNYHFLGDAMK